MKAITFYLVFIICFNLSFVCAQEYNVRNFGAKGDGHTNDYAAIKKVVELINHNKKGVLYFPPGDYYIGEYHDGNNGIEDFKFKNCDSLKIYGNQAKISLKGDFHRTLTSKTKKHAFSNIRSIIPIVINSCKNVNIEDLEINGNVNKMTRDSTVVESGGGLILIIDSKNISLKNLFLHHGQTDGLVIRGGAIPSTKLTAQNIISSNNARQGMTIISLIDAVFTDCKFINTGITEGNYGKHAPCAGIDIEPIHQLPVKNIRFINCLFENNIGSQFVCSSPKTTRDIFFDSCTFNANKNNRKFSIIINAVNVIFTNSSFDCKNGSIYPVWHLDGSSSVFKKCTISSSASGFVAVNDLNNCKVVIDSCILKYTGSQSIKSFFPYIRMKNLSFTNNVVQVPKQYRKTDKTMLIQSATNSGNKFIE